MVRMRRASVRSMGIGFPRVRAQGLVGGREIEMERAGGSGDVRGSCTRTLHGNGRRRVGSGEVGGNAVHELASQFPSPSQRGGYVSATGSKDGDALRCGRLGETNLGCKSEVTDPGGLVVQRAAAG